MHRSIPLTLLLVPLLLVPAAQAQEVYRGDAKPSDDSAFRRIEAFVNAHHDQAFRSSDSAIRDSLQRMLWKFVEEPGDASPHQLSRAYRYLLGLARSDSAVGGDRGRQVAVGLARYASDEPAVAFAEGPVLLAERTADHAEAQALVLRGLDTLDAQMARDRRWFEDDSLFYALRDEQRSVLIDARGWIYFLSGDTRRAEEVLLEAHDLWPNNRLNLFRLGRLYESRANLERAEHFYRLGAMTAAPGDNPNRAALKALYVRTRGSLAGWEEYERAFDETDRALRRDQILADRLAHPVEVPGFRLDRLGGGSLASDELAGRVALINFWGIWCAWCVREMPQLQELYEQYRDTDEVRILTINNDDRREDVERWMREHGYDFPVLYDDGYVAGEAGVTGFPTTWFIDRNGQIVSQKRGWTEQLREEFGWRIESLRSEEGRRP